MDITAKTSADDINFNIFGKSKHFIARLSGSVYEICLHYLCKCSKILSDRSNLCRSEKNLNAFFANIR